MIDEDLTEEERIEAVEKLGIDFTFELVRDEWDGREGQSHWKVILVRGRATYTSSFSHGSRIYNRKAATNSFHGDERYKAGAKIRQHLGRRSVLEFETDRDCTYPVDPELLDVLDCLVSDAGCVCNGETFEEFADNLGYDSDSRQAETTFHTCRDMQAALVRLGLDLEELQDIFQGY